MNHAHRNPVQIILFEATFTRMNYSAQLCFKMIGRSAIVWHVRNHLDSWKKQAKSVAAKLLCIWNPGYYAEHGPDQKHASRHQSQEWKVAITAFSGYYSKALFAYKSIFVQKTLQNKYQTTTTTKTYIHICSAFELAVIMPCVSFALLVAQVPPMQAQRYSTVGPHFETTSCNSLAAFAARSTITEIDAANSYACS